MTVRVNYHRWAMILYAPTQSYNCEGQDRYQPIMVLNFLSGNWGCFCTIKRNWTPNSQGYTVSSVPASGGWKGFEDSRVGLGSNITIGQGTFSKLLLNDALVSSSYNEVTVAIITGGHVTSVHDNRLPTHTCEYMPSKWHLQKHLRRFLIPVQEGHTWYQLSDWALIFPWWGTCPQLF